MRQLFMVILIVLTTLYHNIILLWMKRFVGRLLKMAIYPFYNTFMNTTVRGIEPRLLWQLLIIIYPVQNTPSIMDAPQIVILVHKPLLKVIYTSYNSYIKMLPALGTTIPSSSHIYTTTHTSTITHSHTTAPNHNHSPLQRHITHSYPLYHLFHTLLMPPNTTFISFHTIFYPPGAN